MSTAKKDVVYPAARADATTRAQPHVVWTIWRMITRMVKALGRIKPVGTGDGRADGGSVTSKGTPMQIVLGPVVTRKGGFAFDCWTPMEGFAADILTVALRTPFTRAMSRSDPATREVRIRRSPAAPSMSSCG